MTGVRPVVYVVDDDESVRKGLGRLLRLSGYATETFESAEAFLQQAHVATVPSCAILDVNLPLLSGLDVQRRLLASSTIMPVIFITGHGDIPMSVNAMKAGAVDFLAKPFDADDLLAAVARGLRKSSDLHRESARMAELRRRYLRLTRREAQVLEGIVTGKLNKQVASELGMVEKTVKVHRARIMAKMKARSFAELVRMAVHLGVALQANGTHDVRAANHDAAIPGENAQATTPR